MSDRRYNLLSSKSSERKRNIRDNRNETSYNYDESYHEKKKKKQINSIPEEKTDLKQEPLHESSEAALSLPKKVASKKKVTNRDELSKYSKGFISSSDRGSSNSLNNNAFQKQNTQKQVPNKEEPNYERSGLLAKEANVYNGVALKYSEPHDRAVPVQRYRLYTFKDGNDIDMMQLHRYSYYLIGRERKVADIPIDHPSCSSQHAAIQYRTVQKKTEDGSITSSVIPYIIDLESTNGTSLNNQKINSLRYYQLFSGDVIKFGYSTRTYVIICEDDASSLEVQNVAS